MKSDLAAALEIIRDKALKHVTRSDIAQAAERVAYGYPEVRIEQPWTESELALIAAACMNMKDLA